MKLIYTIIKVIILLLFLLLAVINTDSVACHYLPGQKADLPLIVVLFGAFVIGIVFGIYSSVLVASPLLLMFGLTRDNAFKQKEEKEEAVV